MCPVVDLWNDEPNKEEKETNHKQENELYVRLLFDVPANDFQREGRQDSELRAVWTSLTIKENQRNVIYNIACNLIVKRIHS